MTAAAPECNVCRAPGGSRVKKGVYGNPDQDIFRCRSCGHVFLSPLLTDAEEESFYINEYPAFLLKRGDFKNTDAPTHFAKNRDEGLRRIDGLRPFLGRDKAVLEIGSASGFLLDLLKPLSASATGIEPNADYRAFAEGKGLETLADLPGAGGRKFDLIVSYYVLEHVKDPVGFLGNLKSLLKGPGSRIVSEVPNGEEALVALYKSPAYDEFVWQRAHCSYFSTAVLDKIFTGLGMASEFVPIQRYDISNHLHWLCAGKPGGMGKYARVFSAELDAEYRKNLKDHWLCDSILAVAVSR